MKNKKSYDPTESVKGLQQILTQDKKRIGFLCGAGTSFAKKNDNSPQICSGLQMGQEDIYGIKREGIPADALDSIKADIGADFNVEQLLTNIEEKRNAIGLGKLNGLRKDGFDKLSECIKDAIIRKVSVHNSINMNDLLHVDFARWIGLANRQYAIEIFTTNYDYLFEMGLEANNIPYYDGFMGSYRPFFCPESIEDLHFLPKTTKLWKIHGSLGWRLEDDGNRIIRQTADGSSLLIYPSVLKYTNSKKQPYMAMMDRLTNFIKQPDSVLFICGYSFGDEHINERIMTALKQADSSVHVYALHYDKAGNAEHSSNEAHSPRKLLQGSSKISILEVRSAVFGGQSGEWRLKEEPSIEDTINLYFDEDAPELEQIGKPLDKDAWAGRGNLLLPDFNKFVDFLQSMIP